VQPFTLDQAIIAGLLFVLGILIGMFFLAGGKWKRRYVAEASRREELEQDNARLGAEVREYESLRHAAAKAPAGESSPPDLTGTSIADPYRRVATSPEGAPDIVIRRP